MNGKKIIIYIAIVIGLLGIGYSGGFFTIYLSAEKRLADAQQLIDSANQKLADSEKSNRELATKLSTANDYIGKLTAGIKASGIIISELDGSISQSQDLNEQCLRIIDKYIITK